MTKTYLMLSEAMNIDGLQFQAGPRLSTDDHWTWALRQRGAEVITEEQFVNLQAQATEAGPGAAAIAEAGEEPVSGSHDADDGRRNQITAADSLRSNGPGRRNRRNTRGR